ncbi:uncharacterized protein N7477_002207 [Penicillium maclennaniae]|uniref:uncharacterized protein n=1 Tax=Penicillium maclennaniae TaxID=1343394 RepID=UPI00253FBA42|nr:uncharacterized protein N7477_002207 [Penicillium maclennaniae]KAJ5676574.1 hypothetical protein N7477_002207 [Penicillium maclennaniae]
MGSSMALEGRSLAIFVLATVFMIISFMTVSLRCFVRSYIVRAFGWDDILLLIALTLYAILAVCCMIGTSNGVGHKFTDFTSMVVYERALLVFSPLSKIKWELL